MHASRISNRGQVLHASWTSFGLDSQDALVQCSKRSDTSSTADGQRLTFFLVSHVGSISVGVSMGWSALFKSGASTATA